MVDFKKMKEEAEEKREFERQMIEATTRSRFYPGAVAASRGKIGHQTFDAELAWDGDHYVIGTGYPDRKSAEQAAQTEVNTLLAALRRAGREWILEGKWKKAKP